MCFRPTDLFYWVLYQQRLLNRKHHRSQFAYLSRAHTLITQPHVCFLSIAHKCENSLHPPLSSLERIQTHGWRQTMEHTTRALLLSPEFSTVAKKEERNCMWLHSIPVALFVFGSAVLFARTKKELHFLFGSQSLTSEMRLLTRRRQRKGKSAHAEAERERERGWKDQRKTVPRRCASFGTVSAVIQPAKKLRSSALDTKFTLRLIFPRGKFISREAIGKRVVYSGWNVYFNQSRATVLLVVIFTCLDSCRAWVLKKKHDKVLRGHRELRL